MTFIGAEIRRARLEARLSAGQLAARVRLTPGPRGGQRVVALDYLQDIEAGRILPGPELVQAIANEFADIDPAWWLWLLLTDQWGSETATLMRQQAIQQWAQGGGSAVTTDPNELTQPRCGCRQTDRGLDLCEEHV